MREVLVKAHAKINLSLDVLSQRADGYHELQSVMQSLDLHDTVRIKAVQSGGISLGTDLSYLPVNEKNNAYAAAMHFLDALPEGVPRPGLQIFIEKRIPVCAGLGGGSSDAAAVLRGLDSLYEGQVSREQLFDMALKVGADVPFCLMQGAAFAEGVGERLSPINSMPDCFVLLVKPPVNLSTAKVFSQLNLKKVVNHPDNRGLLAAMQAGDLAGITARMFNVLEPVAKRRHPVIEELTSELLDGGALGVAMTGSGPTVVGVFQQEAQAKAAEARLAGRSHAVFLCRPLPSAE